MKPFERLELLRAATCIVGVDGEITETENRLIQQLADKVGVGKASLNAMLDRAKSDPTFHEEMFRVLRADPNETMITLFHAAMADGNISDGETNILQSLATKLGVDDDQFQNLLAKAKTMTS